MNDRFFWGDTR
jgi:HEAT repeat protein